MRYVAILGERQITIDLEDDGHLREVEVDGVRGRADWQPVGNAARQAGTPGHYALLLGVESFVVYVTRTAAGAAGTAPTFEVTLAGQTYQVQLEDERLHALAGVAGTTHEHGDAPITAPMPGLVTHVIVAAGQRVERGQTVIVLEAMKMENDLAAPRTGVIRQLTVSRGDTVNQGQVLAVVGDAPSDARATDEEDE